MMSAGGSSDSLKPQMAFELFELVGLLRVRPRVSQQHSKGKLEMSLCVYFARPGGGEGGK